MQTIQYRRTRIWEMKKDKYTKTLAKNQVCEIFQMRDIGKNGLPKFTELCMEMPCWCPFQEHQYGRRLPTETSVFEFSYRCVNSSLKELINITVIFILRQGKFRLQNLSKSVMSLTHIRAKCRVMQKPGNSSVLSRKTKNPFAPKICLCKDV